jgi:hypothetical protein
MRATVHQWGGRQATTAAVFPLVWVGLWRTAACCRPQGPEAALVAMMFTGSRRLSAHYDRLHGLDTNTMRLPLSAPLRIQHDH